MNAKTIWACVFALACACGASASTAAPTAGNYVSDVQNTWVQDRVGDRISTVNMIMCMMANLKPDMMVNKGAYLALIDMNSCKGQSSSSKATTTNAGEANSTNYSSVIVDSSQPTASDPLVIKAWIHDDEDSGGGGGGKKLIYVYAVATEGKSATNPNGLFNLYFCGTADTPGATSCDFKGTLKSDGSGLAFYEADSFGSSTSETRLKLQQSDATGDNGIGKIQGSDNGSYAYSFAYDPTYFRRSDGTTDVCFGRDASKGVFSTWRYGVYQQDGSRLALGHPGFPVKFVDNGDTYFGFWSFWGLGLPPSEMSRIGASGTSLSRQVNGADEALSVVKKGGKLWKFTRKQATLSDFKNVALNYSACQQTSHLPAFGDPSCTNYTLQWNGTTLQAVGKTVCSSGNCSPTPLSTPIDLTASEFSSTGINSMSVYSPAGDGIIKVPSGTDFAASTVVYYRTRDAVVPGSSGAPTQLVCVNGCPATFANTSPVVPWAQITALNWGGSGSQTLSSEQNWGPVPMGNAITYSYDGMLKNAGSDIDYSAATQSQMGNFQGGLQSGTLIDANDATALNGIRCDNNGNANANGTNYCPWLANQASTSYQWETGPNQWNQYFGALDGNGAAITFDPPINLAFTVAADGSNIRALDPTKYAGSTMQLQFSGFGELQGIPGSCVDPDTNQPANCTQNSRWVPAFDIVDGSTVSDGSNTYFVKYLEREMRLAKMSGTDEASCKAALALTAANALTLPDATAVDVDSRTKIGSQPSLSSDKPSVIQGVLQ